MIILLLASVVASEQLGFVAPQEPLMEDRHGRGLRKFSPDLIGKASDN
jgi:hypothetical protein